ncbi:hypothetical protein V6N12_063438 [Hibiscus sabdariffa]|uniref:Uncharacterized protein n=1 Tax=Hibiscus sabdariffa TaxID=183260 RepID=A0ABR2FBR5_9ROSI
MLLCSSDLGHCPTVFITPLCSLPPVSMGVPSHPGNTIVLHLGGMLLDGS